MKYGKNRKQIFKPYHLILLTILILPYVIIYISKIEQNKKGKKINIKTYKIHKRKFPFLRKLDYFSDTDKICERTSDKLKYYFQTGDTKYVELYQYTGKTNPPSYIKDLIGEMDELNYEDGSFSDYLSHKTVLILYFIVALFSIIGWITCGICCCVNCSCCECCIKSSCLFILFTICTIMNLIIIACCIIGLCLVGPGFKAYSNGECSMLRFINEGLYGESKEPTPKWLGINGTMDILNRTDEQLSKISNKNKELNFENKINNYNSIKEKFEKILINSSQNIKEEDKYQNNYLSKKYIFDIAKDFGEYNYSTKQFTENSYCDKWKKDFETENFIEKSYKNIEKVTSPEDRMVITRAKSYIKILSDNLIRLRNLFGEYLADTGDDLYSIGKSLAYTFFIIILIVCIILEILLIVFIFFAFGNTYVKIVIHIFWFIFAYLMCSAFFIGCLFVILCNLCPDIVKMLSYVICETNLISENPYIINEGKILNICINGNGRLGEYLELNTIYGNDTNNLKQSNEQINSILDELKNKQKNSNLVYNSYLEEISKRKALDIKNFGLINYNNSKDNLTIEEIISKLNKENENCSIGDRWSFSCKNEFPYLKEEKCNSLSKNKCINPSTCDIMNNELSKKYQNSSCTQAYELSKLLDSILSSKNFAANNSLTNSLYNQATSINKAYKNYLSQTKDILENYLKIIPPSTQNFNLNLNGSVIDYFDCSFLGKHLRVGFHYFHDSAKSKFKAIAVLFFIIGLAMAFSIAFTIAIVIIINKYKKPTIKPKPPAPLDTTNAQIKQNEEKVINEPNPIKFTPPRSPRPSTPSSTPPPQEKNENKDNTSPVIPFPMNTTSHEENY